MIMCCKLGRSILLEEAMARVDAKLISSSRPMLGVQRDSSGLGVFWEALSRGPCWALESWLCFLLAVWPGVSYLAFLSLRSSISLREQ